ncbi:ATP-dependent RNA helicase DDX24 [Anabrus simplex]|uniref:ATP-dependent RNA helicase DDX24 n=1 Tax=Anabrus simplex TaxID=316456 RepID=UPI0035A2B1C4
MIKTKSLSWKPVVINESLLSKGIEGLVGIEELADYDVNSFGRGNKKIIGINTKKRRKRKAVVADGETPSKAKLQKMEKTMHSKRKKKRKKKVRTQTDNESEKEQQPVVEEVESEVENEAEDDVKPDVSDSLPGMEAWDGLHVPLPVMRALFELGFTEPTEIQQLTLPPAILGRRDILGAAETGSGKTLAFGIPILHSILAQKSKEELDVTREGSSSEEDEEDSVDESRSGIGCVKVIDDIEPTSRPTKKLYALILTPTRELAMQVRDHLVAAAKYTGIRVAVVVGGMASQKQERLLRRGPEIVVATPGRLWELIQEGNPHLAQIDDIRLLAVDETDRMVERGHFQELQTLLERINIDEEKKKLRQNFVFSATLTLVHEPPRHIGKRKTKRITPGQKLQSLINMLGITNPKVVDVTKETGTASTLSEARILCPLEDKDFYLYYFLERHPGRTLVFCNSISCVRRLAQLLSLLQCKPLPLHANMIQRQRLKNLERFRNDSKGLLLATDVAARGLDIPNVEHVIHYQVPRTSESYVHRSGRTARAHKEGLTLLLIEPTEVPNYARLCRTLGRERDLPNFPVVDSLFFAIKERVRLARDLDQLELASRRNNAQTSWFQKAVKEMDIIIDKDDLPTKFTEDTSAKIKKQARIVRQQLNALLERPLFRKGFSGKYPTRTGKLEVPFETTDAVQAVKFAHKPGMYVRRRNDD